MKRRWLRIIFGVMALAAFAYLGRKYFSKLDLLLHPNPLWILAMTAVYLLTRLLNAEVMCLALRRLRRDVSLGESFVLTMVMSYANLFIPHAGLGAPALYLKHKYDLKYAAFGAILMPLMVLQLACAGGLGLVGAAWLGATDGWAGKLPLMALFAAVLVGGVGLMFVRLWVPRRFKTKFVASLRRFNRSRRLLLGNPMLLVKVLIFHVGAVMLRAVRLELAFYAVGYGGHFPAVFVASICAQFMLLVSLTPGAFGFREVAAVAVYAHLVGEPEIAVSAVLLDRILVTSIIIVLAQFGLWTVVRPVLSGKQQADAGV